MSGHSVEAVQKQVRTYIIVFVALAVLTVVTVAVSYLHLPVHLAVLVALAVATVKATLVAAYFMHLVSEKKLIWAILILSFFFFLHLLLIPSWHPY